MTGRSVLKNRKRNRIKRKKRRNNSSHTKEREHEHADLKNMMDQWRGQALRMHYINQISHWKSKAIALEYENNFLHSIIKNIYTNNKVETDDESSEESIDEEYLNFMRISAEHRLQRDKAKKMDVEDDDATCAPPPPTEESSHQIRLEELSSLYGNDPDVIRLETAALLRYQNAIDSTNPPYWPNIPLNIRYSVNTSKIVL